MPENTRSPVPQFATAEYATATGAATCKACAKALGSSHYRVNGVLMCSSCAERIKDQLPKDSHAAFVGGITFGVGAALIGLVLYVIFALTTGLVIGFVSLAVGYIVGKAIVMGSKGQGGRRYQIAAVALTYVAVSLSSRGCGQTGVVGTCFTLPRLFGSDTRDHRAGHPVRGYAHRLADDGGQICANHRPPE